MKQTLRISFFFLLFLALQAFSPAGNSGVEPDVGATPVVYPNPVYDQLSLKNDESVKSIVILNLTGRQVLRFQTTPGKKYDVGELSSGLYLVQFLNKDKKVIVTQRMKKL